MLFLLLAAFTSLRQVKLGGLYFWPETARYVGFYTVEPFRFVGFFLVVVTRVIVPGSRFTVSADATRKRLYAGVAAWSRFLFAPQARVG